MPSWLWDVLIILVLILLNGFFALAELATVSARRGRLQALAEGGHVGAQRALALSASPGMFLSSVQVGVTLVSVLVGAFGGTRIAELVAPVLTPWLGASAWPVSFLLVVGLVTYVTLILGELVPKRLALSDPERWAVAVARPMQAVAAIGAPVVRALSASSDLVLRLLPVKRPTRPPITDEEIRMLFEEGIAAGVFERAEKEIVDRLFRLSDRRVRSVMTPSADVAWLALDAPRETIISVVLESPHAAYPVVGRGIDDLRGVVLTCDLVGPLIAGAPLRLAELLHAPLVLPEGSYALAAIDKLRESGVRLAIVIDEYGGTAGVLTLTDIFASLVGEIPSVEEPDVVKRPDGSLLVDGFLPADEVRALLDTPTLPGEEEAGYQTLAGFIMTALGRVPHIGDAFSWGGFRFEVVDMDGNRIDRVLISPERRAA